MGNQEYHPHWMGSNKTITLSKQEPYLIYELETLFQSGHNIEFDTNCFIKVIFSHYYWGRYDVIPLDGDDFSFYLQTL